MAGMFYSLEEAIAKLNMTEAQLKEFVKEGKLREFCLDSNVLYKVDEVEALSSGTGTVASEETPVVPAERSKHYRPARVQLRRKKLRLCRQS
jgi:hypothetical protein